MEPPFAVELPKYPDVGDKFSLPNDTPIGRSAVLEIRVGTEVLAHAMSLQPIPNVTKKIQAQRIHANEELVPGNEYNMIVYELPILELVFQEWSGWVPSKYGPAEIDIDVLCRLENNPNYVMQSGSQFIYDAATFSVLGGKLP